MKFDIQLENPCKKMTIFCVNCHNHFLSIRPLIKEIVVSRHFIRDLKDEKIITSIINNILDCAHLNFNELHKYEETIDGNLVFRAKKDYIHIVYCINKDQRAIIFLRAIKHFSEYKRFLDNRKLVKRIIYSSINS